MTNPWEKYKSSATDADAAAGDGPWKAYAPTGAPGVDWEAGEIKPPSVASTASDLGKSLKAGVQRLPGMAAGLADLPIALATGARPVTQAADYLGKATGFQPGKWADETKFSQGYEDSKKSVDEAWKGFDEVSKDQSTSKMDAVRKLVSDAPQIAGAYLQNPNYTLGQVAESVPSIFAGGALSKVALGVGRVAGVAANAATGTAARAAVPGALARAVGDKWAVPVAAGLGEGAITAGDAMAHAQGPDQQKNALAALGAGAGTALIGAGAGRVANALGLETAETALARAGTRGANGAPTPPASMLRRVLGGMVSEAVLQELPQSAQEQMWQNFAEGKPLWDGVARAGTEGALAGGVMGVAANIRGGQGVPPPGQQDLKARSNAEAAAADAQARADSAQPPWGTSPGAADPNAVRATGAASAANAPRVESADFSTSPGAAAPNANGMDFTRDVDTSGLSLQDPAEIARQRAATIDYDPVDTTPAWGTQPGAERPRAGGLDLPSREIDTGTLAIGDRPLSEKMGLNPAAGPLSASAAVAVDSGAYMPPAGTPGTDPAAASEADPMVLQNRDRTSAASIAQVQEIAANPDYLRVGPSRDMTSGAPIVFGEMPPTAILGRAETVVDGKGERMGTQYAVVDAGDLIASNNADGTTVAEYATGQPGKLRSVAGNGRTAGLQAAYDKGTAGKYQQELAADAEALGIDAEALLGMKRPVLVRVMQESEVTNDMGDRTNITATQKLSPLEQAGNDARRLDVRRLSFDEGGSPTLDSIQGFVSAMPVAERGDMLNADGTPTRQAVDRLMAATFKQAYDSDELVQLYAQATDPDARAVMAAAADASGVMANLKGAGAFDVRAAVADAAKMAVNAARQSLKLQDVLQNQDMDMNPDAFPVAAFMAQNIRTPKKMAEGLRRWGQLALEQARIAEENTRQGGMFGAAPTLSRQEIFARLGDSNNPAQQSIAPAQAELASADSQTPQSNPNGDPNEPSPNQAEQTEAQPTQSGTAQDSVAAPAKPNPRGVLAKLEAVRAQRKAAAEAKSAAAAPAQAEPLQLESYTEGELRAQAQAQDETDKAAAQQEAKRAAADKARTDQADVDARMGASSDNFVLGQDANDAVSGQDSVLDAPAEQAPAAAPVTAAPEARAKTPAPRKLSVPEKARQAQEAARADYFVQGNIVKSYSGHDRVVGYQPTEGPSASWSATVQAVEKQGGQWVDVPGTSPRTHATQPDAREMKAGPVKRGLGAIKTEAASAEQASGAGSNEADAPMFSRAQAKEVRNLVTLHNLSEENLLYADSIGGIPAPSIGITKVDSPFGGFGGITLIAPKGMIDPEAGVPVYDRDAWTARFPAMNFKRVKAAAADAFYGRMKPAKALGDDGDSFVSMLWERVKNDSTQSPGKVMELFRQYQAARVLYAREVLGKEIKVPMRDVPLSGPMAQDKPLLAYWKANQAALASMNDSMSTENFRATPEFQQLSGQVEAALERAWPNEDRPGKREALRKTFREVLFDDDGLMSASAFIDLARDAAKVGTKEIDRVKLGAALDKVVKRDDPAYLKWAESLVAPLFEPPTITLRGREVAPTLENLTQAMTVGATEGVEKSMAFGAGKTAAMLGKRFKSLKEIQAARDQVVSQQQEQEGKKATDVVLDAYREAVLPFYTERDWRGQIDTWAGNDAAMEALARAGKIGDSPVAIRAALAKMGFKSVDAQSLRLARQAIDALRNAATDYFEAKPQRAVALNEFKGAVVPKGTSAEAMAVLEKHGIEVEVHGKAEGAREKAIQKLAKRLDKESKDVLFSRSPATKAAYEERIDALYEGRAPSAQGVRVLDRSDMLELLGMGDGPVHIVEGKVAQGRFNHGLTAGDWKKVPQWLDNPAAVFDSDTQPGRLVFIAPELVRGAPVRMIVDPRPDGKGVNLLVNAYDAERNPLQRWEREGLLRYFDQQKAPPVTGSFQPRLAGLPGDRGRGKILTQKQLAGWRRANNPAFSFAGERAASADTHALDTARQRLDAGEDAEAVRRDTGWHQGVDGKWRFEIADNEASLLLSMDKTAEAIEFLGGVTVGDVLNHPKLFTAYPSLANIPLDLKSGKGASLANATINGVLQGETILLGREIPSGDLLGILLHELQHGIQSIEGFATGGNAGMFAQGPMFSDRARDLAADLSENLTGGVTAAPAEIFASINYADKAELGAVAAKHGFANLDEALLFLKSQDEKRTPFGQYKRLAGEVEARNTQKRQNITALGRKFISPVSTADVPASDVIVTFNGKEMQSAPAPANAVQASGRELQPLANQSSAKALNATLVKYGLGQDWSNAYEAVKLPDALSGIRDAVQAAFGRDVRPVAPTAARFDIFNGIYLPSRPGDVYVNAASDVGFIQIAGHELWHSIKRSRPDLIEWYRERSRQHYKDLPAYRDRLNALVQDGEKKYDALAAEEELEADFMGDSLADPAFLQQLADASPSKFRSLLDHVQRWLAAVASKLNIKGLGSSKEVTDVKALQGYLKEVLVAFAEGKGIPAAPQGVGPKFSLDKAGGSANADILFSRTAAAIDTSMGVMNADQEQAYRRVAGTKKVPTLKDRMASLKANFGLKARQALVDQFAAIKQLDQKAYMQARMSKASDGALEATLLYGKPFLRDGVPDVDIRDGGFAKVLASLNGEHDRWMMWIAAQRAERLKTEGKENLMTDDDISALKSLNAGKMANGAMRLPVYANALKELNAYNEAMLTMSMQSGLIDQDTVDLMRDQPYVPFYRLMEDADFEGPRFSSGLKNQQAWKKLKGGTQQLNADLLQNTLMNWSHLLQASARNRAALATMDAAEGLAIAYKVPATTNGRATKDAVKVMRNGKTEHWTVEDPYLLEAVGALNYTVSPLMKPLTKMKQILTMAVTVNPTFKIRNLIRDSVSAIAQSELGYNPAANVGKAWKLTAGDSQIYASMLAGGGIIKFGTQENTDRLRKQVEKLGGQVLDKKGMDKLTGQVGALWDAYSEFGDRTENVNRVALYDQLIKKGHSHAEASFMARDLMDFSMGGAMPLVRFLTQTVPFLNARLVGLDKLGRAAMDDPRKFATVAGAVALASVALLMMYAGDDDWKEREDWDRDTYWWFKIGSTAYRIPKPFEVGAIGTMAERTAELMFDKEMTGKRFTSRMAHMFSQTFAFDPVPQAIKPLLDVYSNKDSFTKRAIETPSEQRMKPADRYNERTSETAKLLGQLGLPEPSQLIKGDYMAMSPKQIDHLIRGYFSWVGVTATSAADMLVRPLMDKGDKPDMQLRDMFLVGNFAQGLPAGGSRYVTQMYEQSRQVQQAYASYQNALKLGDLDKARDIQETDGDKLRSRMAYTHATEQMAALGQQAKKVEASRTMTGEEKRQRLDEIARQRNAIAKRTSGLTM